jgi:hypothetical protein
MDRHASFDVISLIASAMIILLSMRIVGAALLISSKPVLRILRSSRLVAAVFASCYPLVFNFVHRSL